MYRVEPVRTLYFDNFFLSVIQVRVPFILLIYHLGSGEICKSGDKQNVQTQVVLKSGK